MNAIDLFAGAGGFSVGAKLAGCNVVSMMAETLLLAWTGETFVLGSTPIWVRPVAVALSVQGGAA